MPGIPLIPIDHAYIEERDVAQRFVNGKLRQTEREAFERHYVDCQECMDRIALARIVRAGERQKKGTIAIFSILATFTPRQQGLIFAASTLALVLMPVFAVNWMNGRTAIMRPETEIVIWLPPSGSVEARFAPSAQWISVATALPGEGTFRISIVDVADRPIVTGPDQIPAQGTALGLRLPSLPSGVSFAVVEKKAENGAYSMVSRHPLIIEWR